LQPYIRTAVGHLWSVWSNVLFPHALRFKSDMLSMLAANVAIHLTQ
jgi:hypothetical protein